MIIKFISLLAFSLFCFLAYATDSTPLSIADFSKFYFENWEAKEFQRTTSYKIIQLEGKNVLIAESEDSASALIKKTYVDLKKHPYLNWSWRIENRLETKDEKIKIGDDYAARIYVVIDGGILPWRTKAINYVWANQASKHETWPNAFAGKNAMMMALRNKQDKTSVWHIEKRNVYEDLKQLFGTEFQFIDAIALMTDTDNDHGQVKAYYGDIYFTSE
jgi:hypothetical protein